MLQGFLGIIRGFGGDCLEGLGEACRRRGRRTELPLAVVLDVLKFVGHVTSSIVGAPPRLTETAKIASSFASTVD